jgi:CRISPR-associated protein Cmr3
MSVKIFDLHAPSPLLFRDGKPFSAAGGTETAVRSLPAPLPSTLAGFIRTQIGMGSNRTWQQHDLEYLHGIPVAGLLARDEQLVFPAPRDAVICKNDAGKRQIMRLRPLDTLEGTGTDAPAGMVPLEVKQDVKPETGYDLWTQADMETWLKGQTPQTLEPISGLPLETRVHVSINARTGATDDGQLFSVGYRSFESRDQLRADDAHFNPDSLPNQFEYHRWSIRTRLKLPDNARLSNLGHLGGERRAVTLSERDHEHWWSCPEELKNAIRESQYLKLVLATPAIFKHGWKPGWLENELADHMPKGLHGVKLKLISAGVGKREPVSGWNLRTDSAKAVRYMVPAGSVYFFEVLSGKQEKILENWLKPVSDNEQDRKDGFGLALWGVWK